MRHGREDRLRGRALERVPGPDDLHPLHDLADRGHDARVAMAENEGAPGHHLVDVPVAVEIPDIRALCLSHEERMRTHRGAQPGPHSATDAAARALERQA